MFAGGAKWLEKLPNLLAECERRWGLVVHPTNFTLSYNYVAPATLADGTEIVLKEGVLPLPKQCLQKVQKNSMRYLLKKRRSFWARAG